MTSTAPAPQVRTSQLSVSLRAAGVERGTLALAAVLTGLIAGFYYAYACSVMLGLAQTDDRTFIDTMQAINATVRNWWFAPSFFGSVLVTVLALVIVQVRRSPGRGWVGAAALLVAAGFALTLGVNVPLNDQLAAAGPAEQIGDPAAVRAAYEDGWVAWNIVRTVLSVSALAALVRAALLSRPLSGPLSGPRD